MTSRALATAALAAAALCFAPPAHAGTYQVHACTVDGRTYDNRSWTLDRSTPGGIEADVSCPEAGDPISLGVRTGARTADGASQALVFESPRGTTITDFRIERRLRYGDAAPEGTHPYYVLYGFGDPFAGAGDYWDGTRDRLHAERSWYGYPSGPVDQERRALTRASFPAIAAGATSSRLAFRLGCLNRATPCGVAPGGGTVFALHGTTVTISDPTRPALTVAAEGLLAPGPRDGSDPVVLTATDNAGIRRVDLIDVTGGGAANVGFEEYDPDLPRSTRTDRGSTCSARLAKSCPDLARETVRPTALPVGSRRLLVQVTDRGGNVTQAGPYPVDVVVPSARGARNGANGTEAATLTAGFTTGGARRTVAYGRRPTVRGTLVDDAGQPIPGAELVVLTRNADSERFVQRRTVRTDAAGGYELRVKGTASRLIQVGYRAFLNDSRFAANGYVTMRVRATASLEAPKAVRLGRAFSLRGRLKGVERERGVRLVAQGRTGGGRYETFATVRTRKGGRYRLRYRFRSASSRGRAFRLRLRVLERAGRPYAEGRTRTVRVRVR